MWESTDKAIETVRHYVDKHQPGTYRLVVNDDPESIRQEESWWYFVVRPDRGGIRSNEYAETLCDIEEEILEKERVHVLLVPTLAY